jgi:hypothetical protein
MSTNNCVPFPGVVSILTARKDGVAEYEPAGYILRTMNTIKSVDDEKHPIG